MKKEYLSPLSSAVDFGTEKDVMQGFTDISDATNPLQPTQKKSIKD